MPRPRKGAHIYHRPGRRGWYAYLDRENRDISLETEDEQEAQEALSALLDRRRLRQLAPNDRPISEIVDECLRRAAANHTKKTAYEIGLNLKRVLAWLHGRDVYSARQACQAALVEDYKTSRRFDKVGAARINREIDSWKKAALIAVEEKVIPKAALEVFVRIREPRPLPHQPGLTMAMIKKFLAAEKDPGYRALFRTVVGTGIRDDEMRHLEASDIRPPWLVVTPKDGWTTKGYRYRSIPISKATEKAARAFLKARQTLKLDDPKWLWKRIQANREAAGIQLHFSMHDLRRAWASHMLAAGHRIEEISKWLGHADVMTTMRYLRVVNTATPKPSSLPF